MYKKIHITSVLGTVIIMYAIFFVFVKSCNIKSIVLKMLRGSKVTIVLSLLGGVKSCICLLCCRRNLVVQIKTSRYCYRANLKTIYHRCFTKQGYIVQ
jgi:hypothetical protein